MWNVVFVMGLESLSMNARGMELSEAARRFFSPPCSVAMALGSHKPKTLDEKRVLSTVSVVWLFFFSLSLFFHKEPNSKRVHETS